MDISTPLKPAVFYILLALADHDRHGYAVMQAVRERSHGLVPLRTGSFYRHLSKLIENLLYVSGVIRILAVETRVTRHVDAPFPSICSLEHHR